MPIPAAALLSLTLLAPARERTDLIAVTFRDGPALRLRNGTPTDIGQADALAPAAALLKRLEAQGCTWERGYPDVSEDRLDQLHATARKYWGVPIANLNSQFTLRLPPALGAARVCAELEASAPVRRAEPYLVGGPENDPTPPDFTPRQYYFAGTPGGINNAQVATWPGGLGAGMRVCDVERQWNVNHQEFGGTLLRAGPGTSGDPNASSNDHGTAVLGVLVARTNGYGTTGSIPLAQGYYAHVYLAGVYNVAAAVVNATGVLNPGSVMLIEQQMLGPVDVIAMEWRLDVYNAIRTAVGNGIVVCEAAGNGYENLDAPIYSQGNGGHYPFRPENDSGAIMVGAGAAAVGGSTVSHSRLGFSNYGATLDLQGWGESVFTLAYGDAYSAEGVNLRYTSAFSGTSSATPIVASACALLESVNHELTGQWLTPSQVKNALRATGVPQAGGLYPPTQNIGPFPNVRAAILSVLPSGDCNANGLPDIIDVRMGSPDGNHDGVPDECQGWPCNGDFDGDGDYGTDADIEAFFACLAGNCCSRCHTPDFDGDGSPRTDADIQSFFRVMAGGPC